MVESEIIEAYLECQSLAMNAMVIYLSITSGYLLVAYSVGPRLTRSQVIFISSLFVAFGLFTVWGVFAYFQMGDHFENLSTTWNSARFNPVGLNAASVVSLIELMGILGCLVFMRGVRREPNPAR